MALSRSDRLRSDRLAPAVEIDTRVPNPARVWNYWLNGKEDYPVDREAGDQVVEILPGILQAARHSRAFLARAIWYLAGEAGIRQFLDIGVGMPTVDNTHEIAQRVAPDARVVYVDNDALTLAHARALLRSDPEEACGVIDADVRDVEVIAREAGRTLDLAQPVALLLLNILNYIVDDADAQTTVERLVAALAPGSHVVIAHPTAELDGERVHKALQLVMDMGGAPVVARTPRQIESVFDGLVVLEPGVVSCSRWRPDHTPFGPPPEVLQFCGVARVPDRGAGR